MISVFFYYYFLMFRSIFGRELYGLPGGDQVDGLPPAASADQLSVDGAVTTDLFTKLADFLKKMSFSDISIHFLYFSPLKMINVDPHARGFAPL